MREFLAVAKALSDENRVRALLFLAHKDGRWVYYRLAGREAPAVAREALAWVRRNLAEDPTVRADARCLRRVRRMDRGKLCAHYR